MEARPQRTLFGSLPRFGMNEKCWTLPLRSSRFLIHSQRELADNRDHLEPMSELTYTAEGFAPKVRTASFPFQDES